MKVQTVRFNWHQVGSLNDHDGTGEDWTTYTVGEQGVTLIVENEPRTGMQQWNYVIHFENGNKIRIFNPNLVKYINQ